VLIRTKLAVASLAVGTLGFLGVIGVAGGAQAATPCGTPEGANAFPGTGPVYTSGPPSGSFQGGYAGVGANQGGDGGYVQATATSSSGGVNADVTANGGAGGQSGVVAIGNDAASGGGSPVGYCQD